ncbi:hypothetical protein MUA04_11050 [Enterobacteriaceae bacterium H11S18]|uniref:hypothetical protein n=1 Tax=Dryocola clanedunensis TaxID=2925396 RepID=UPI0022F113E1|nr:hypothetical protein [Dryocola clanedunensis]MCT4710724.1 hypothetical protein [Dryocola clanedunensis]
MNYRNKARFVTLFLLAGGGVNSLYAEDEQPLDAAQMEKIAKMTANPVGAAWMFWGQYDNTQIRGDKLKKAETVSKYTFQPVMSFPVRAGGADLNFVVRPVLQYYNAPNLGNLSYDGNRFTPQGRMSGMGDSALLTLLGPNRDDGFVWGVGATQIFDTAENDLLGQGHYQAGPAVLLAKLAPKAGGTNVGVLAQHWWSVDKNDRADTSQSNIQYFINYRMSTTELVGMSPNITVNWKNDRGDKLTFPVGLGYSNVIKMGALPVRFAAELQYSVISPDDIGSRWNLRFMFIPVIPSPFL